VLEGNEHMTWEWDCTRCIAAESIIWIGISRLGDKEG